MGRFCGQCGAEVSSTSQFCQCCEQALNQNATPVGTEQPEIEAVNDGHGDSGKAKKICCLIAGLSAFILLIGVVFVVIFFLPDEPRDFDEPSNSKIPSTETTKENTSSPPVKTNVEGQSLGSIEEFGGVLHIEYGTFPGGAEVTLTECDDEDLPAYNHDKFNLIGSPLRLMCDQYDGNFFTTRVTLKMSLPKKGEINTEDLAKCVFVYFDKNNNEARYWYPDRFNISEGTMEVELPHFSEIGAAELTQQGQIEDFLDKYSTELAVEKGRYKKAAADLEPYVQAKIEALDLQKEAADDLKYAVINTVGGGFAGDFAAVSSIGTNVATSMYRAVNNNDHQGVQDAVEDMITNAVVDSWDKLRFNKTAGGVLGKANSCSKIAGRITDGDYEGALREVGNVMQSVHPSVELITKGAHFAGTSLNLIFTDWKSNKIEELYQIYKRGGSGDFWGNDVEARNRKSFLDYLNYANGVSVVHGVRKFYNMDKVADACKKLNWPYKNYDELPLKYQEKFADYAENALMEYFEIRLEQEEEAKRIKEAERCCIEEMLKSPDGALISKDYCKIFGEDPKEEINIAKRLEMIVKIRNIISVYVDEKELERCRKAGSYNYGYLTNLWLRIYTNNPKDRALDMFLAELKRLDLIKERFRERAATCQLKDFEGLWGNGEIFFKLEIHPDHIYFNPEPYVEKYVWHIKDYKFNDRSGVLSFDLENESKDKLALKVIDESTLQMSPPPPKGENAFYRTDMEEVIKKHDEKYPKVKVKRRGGVGTASSISLDR